jgi:hypothetical protein
MNPSHEKGLAFEDHVADTLAAREWTIVDRNVDVNGIEIDIVTTSPVGSLWFVECKGGDIVGRSGLARTDTVKKAVGAAWALRDSLVHRSGRYFVVTTMMPTTDSVAHRLVTDAVDAGLLAGAGTVDALLTLHDVMSGTLPERGIVRRMEW